MLNNWRPKLTFTILRRCNPPMKTKFVVLLLACSCMAAAYGQGTLQITFDGPPVQPPNTQVGVTNYFEGGMSFRPLAGVNGLVRNGGGISFYPDDGSAYLQGLLSNTLMFSFTNGLLFGLVSVDLAEYSTVLSGPTDVEFVGYHPDGSTVTTSFTTDGIIDGTGPLADFQTFSFNGLGFTNLTRVEIPSSDWSLDNLVVSPEVAETWTQASATTNYYWWSVAMSADGCKLAAVGSTDHPIFSTDAGATWHTNQSSPYTLGSIASSADGTRLVAPMAISNNYAGSGIFVSTNSGDTWTKTTAPTTGRWSSWQYVTSSGAGDRLGAIMWEDSHLNSIYVSTNSGLSWSRGVSPSKYWTSLTCSADGTKFIATASGDKIYVSTNFGTNWTATTSPNDKWISVACNADGTRLIASGSATHLYFN